MPLDRRATNGLGCFISRAATALLYEGSRYEHSHTHTHAAQWRSFGPDSECTPGHPSTPLLYGLAAAAVYVYVQSPVCRAAAYERPLDVPRRPPPLASSRPGPTMPGQWHGSHVVLYCACALCSLRCNVEKLARHSGRDGRALKQSRGRSTPLIAPAATQPAPLAAKRRTDCADCKKLYATSPA